VSADGWQAIVHAAVAPMLAEPSAAAVQVSQRLAGHPVDVLRAEHDWLLVRGADGYEGWVHTGYLSRAPGDTARRSRAPALISLGCHTRTPGGGRRALPLGAYLAPDETLASGEAVAVGDAGARFPRTAAAIGRTAQEYFDGTSYQWGGITPWGADCSGFVQTVFWLHGIALPRDAWQQGEQGTPGARGLTALQGGELAFFSDRSDDRITHVGLGIGGGRMAHVAIGRGGFSIEHLSEGRDSYVRKLLERFRFVRQVLPDAS
jgi:gamma-D-glutamyl-L-lysine dipeptidyl-peptidase